MNTRVTPCKHKFHHICLGEWEKKTPICPMDRLPLNPNPVAGSNPPPQEPVAENLPELEIDQFVVSEFLENNQVEAAQLEDSEERKEQHFNADFSNPNLYYSSNNESNVSSISEDVEEDFANAGYEEPQHSWENNRSYSSSNFSRANLYYSSSNSGTQNNNQNNINFSPPSPQRHSRVNSRGNNEVPRHQDRSGHGYFSRSNNNASNYNQSPVYRNSPNANINYVRANSAGQNVLRRRNEEEFKSNTILDLYVLMERSHEIHVKTLASIMNQFTATQRFIAEQNRQVIEALVRNVHSCSHHCRSCR